MENNNKKSFGQIVSNFSMPILLLLLMLVLTYQYFLHNILLFLLLLFHLKYQLCTL